MACMWFIREVSDACFMKIQWMRGCMQSGVVTVRPPTNTPPFNPLTQVVFLMRMTRIIPAVLLLAVSLLVLNISPATATTPDRTEAADKPEVIGVLLYADWCGSCKTLEPKLDEVKPAFSGAPILFTQFDLTDDYTAEQSRLYAQWTGLDALFEAHEGRTGYVVLINAETHEELGRLTSDQSEDELREAIASVLSS